MRLFAALALLAPPAAQDPSFAGVWQAALGAYQGRGEVAADGEYASRLAGPGNLPGEHGWFEPSTNGRWRM